MIIISCFSFHCTRRHPFPAYHRDASSSATIWRRFLWTTSTPSTGRRRWRRVVTSRTRSRQTRRRRGKVGWERSICRKSRTPQSSWKRHSRSEWLPGNNDNLIGNVYYFFLSWPSYKLTIHSNLWWTGSLKSVSGLILTHHVVFLGPGFL